MALISSHIFPDFEPHGLIASPFLEADYRSTATFPREVNTLVLLENIFNKVIFKNQDDVTVNSFRSSYRYDNEKCHFVVKYFDKENRQREILCFTEDVRGVGDLSVIREFEAHVIRYCYKYLYGADGLPDFVYVCTAFGACLRIWKQFRGDHEFGGLWGGYGLTEDISSYLDVGNSDSSRRIQQALDQITSQSREPEGEDIVSFYSETTPRKVDSWIQKDESGATVRSFSCQAKRIDTKRMDWKKANSGIFSKKRLIYQKGGHNVWTEL